jgi:DNA-binding MarR family transcriptional regulator
VLTRLYRLLESARTELTVPQYRVLAAIADGGGRSARLAERLAMRAPTLTAIADALVNAGYVTRESEPGDRRVVKLSATEAGRAALGRADLCFVDRLAPVLAEIDHADRFLSDLVAVGAALDARQARKMSQRTAAPEVNA